MNPNDFKSFINSIPQASSNASTSNTGTGAFGLPLATSQTANQETQSKPGFLQSVAAGIVRPFARLGTNLINAGQEIVGAPTTQPFSGKFLGDVTPVGMANGGGLSVQNLKDSVGTGLELGSYLIGGEGAGGVVETGLKGLLKQSIIQGAKVGATAGAMQGAGQSLTENQGIGNTLLNTGIGAVTGGVTGGVLGGITGGIGLLKNGSPVNEGENLVKLNDTLSPKATVKEARLAESQGRLYSGQDATLLKGETANKIATSDSQFNTTMTVNRLIPNASKLDEPTLANVIDDKTTELAQNLKPEMVKTPINPPTIDKINSDWATLKASQLKNADTTAEKELITSWQNRFEERLQNSGNQNMNDLWETRIAYDNSIPNAVKKANDMSAEGLQMKKDLWLQNRSILNAAINDTQNGLGKTSQQAFKDMSNLYNAKGNLLTKATTSSAKLLPSKLSQAINSPTGKIIKYATGGATLFEGGKRLLTGGF